MSGNPSIERPPIMAIMIAFARSDEMISHVRIPLTAEYLDALLQKRRIARQATGVDPQLFSMIFADEAPQWYDRTDSFWDLEDEGHPAYHVWAWSDGQGQIVAADAMDAGEDGFKRAPVDHTKLHLRVTENSRIMWSGFYADAEEDIELTTRPLYWPEILFARCYLAEPAEFDARFADLAAEAPAMALEIIERGFVLGPPKAERIVPGPTEVAPEILQRMLQHESVDIRYGAIRVLDAMRSPGESGASTDQRRPGRRTAAR